jgi:hypothetical protein
MGNMEGGTSGTGSINVFVGNKEMTEGSENDGMYGYSAGTVTLTYEDEFGEVYTSETDISTTINEPVIAVTDEEPEEDPEKAGQWWVTILVGGAIVAGLVIFTIARKTKKRQNHEAI